MITGLVIALVVLFLVCMTWMVMRGDRPWKMALVGIVFVVIFVLLVLSRLATNLTGINQGNLPHEQLVRDLLAGKEIRYDVWTDAIRQYVASHQYEYADKLGVSRNEIGALLSTSNLVIRHVRSTNASPEQPTTAPATRPATPATKPPASISAWYAWSTQGLSGAYILTHDVENIGK